jgi:predicted HD phosphohydrolase
MTHMPPERRAAFHQMTEGTREDWMIIGGSAMEHNAKLADRVIAHLSLLANDYGGFAVDRLEHSLQTATRAHRDGRDEEYVVCALLHDVGDTLGSMNHADIAAAILKPFISEQNLFMLEKHGIFQGYYFFHHLGMNRDAREEFRGHPWFDRTARFCELYDGPAFDPRRETLPLEHFEPMVRRVLAAPRQTIYAAGTKAPDTAFAEPDAKAVG